MGKCIYILFSIAGILSVPIILLLIWLLLAICGKFFEGFVATLESFRKCRLKFVENAAEYKNNIAKFSKMNEEDLIKLKEGKKEIHKIIWSYIISWTNVHYIITAFIASFIVAIIFLLLTLCVDGYVTDKERVVLAFVGVLATFVVLTNHAQSFERIKEMEKLIKDTKDELREMMDNQKIDNEKTLKSKITESTSKHMLLTFRFLQACQDPESYTLAKELFEDAKKKPDKIYKIQPQDGEEINARLVISRNTIKFISSTYPYAMIHNNQISKVDDKNYDYAKVSTIVVVLGQIDEIEKTPKSTSL